MYATKNYPSSSVPRFGDRWIFSNWRWQMLVSHEFSPHGQFLYVGRIQLRNLAISASSWQSLTRNLLLSNLRRVAGHITRERDMYDLAIGGVLRRKNLMTCANTLMNGHWEGLVGKVEELLHATNHPDNNYRMLIQQIIQYSSDGEQCLESCTWESVGGTWTGSSSVSGCASTLVDLQQRLGDRAWWIYGWINRRPIVNRVFNQVLRDHPDLRHAVNA